MSKPKLSLSEDLRIEADKNTRLKETMPEIFGKATSWMYENSQLLVRYAPFLEAYRELQLDGEITDDNIYSLLEKFGATNLFDNIKRFIETGKLDSLPRTRVRVFKKLSAGANSEESWLRFYLFGLPDNQIFTFAEGLSLYLDANEYSDDVIPEDFPEQYLSFNYIPESNAIEFFIRIPSVKRFKEQRTGLVDLVTLIARHFFDEPHYEMIKDLDRKLVILDEGTKKINQLKSKQKDPATGEEIKLRRVCAFYDMYSVNDDLTEEEEEQLEKAMQKKYQEYRDIKSDINAIQQKRFVKNILT